MVWVAVGVGVISAGASIYSSSQASKASSNAANRAANIDLARLDFQYQQYSDWQDVYGPIQDNLSNFYQNLTGDSLIASGLEQYAVQNKQVNEDLKRSFAQRGIDTGAQDLLNMQNDIQTAQFKARLRNDAPLLVAQAKEGFLNGNVTNPGATGVANAQAAQASGFRQQANQFAANAGAGYQAAGVALNGAANAYINRPQQPTPTPPPPQTTVWT